MCPCSMGPLISQLCREDQRTSAHIILTSLTKTGQVEAPLGASPYLLGAYGKSY